MIITRTPYRVSLFGGGSDFPDWYRQYGGAVLGGAIDKYCYLTLRFLPPFFEHKSRIVYSRIENAIENGDIQHPAVRAALELHQVGGGVEIHHDGDLPARSGIGSSAAFAVGLVHAIRALVGKSTDAWELAMEAIHLEQVLLEEATGSQDQVLCALGGFRHVQFHTNGTISSEVTSQISARKQELEDWLVLLYSGEQRSSSAVSQVLLENLNSNEELMHRNGDLAALAREAMESTGSIDMQLIAGLLDESWRLKLALNPRSASPTLLEMYAQAQAAGALAGKVAGAGGGGFMLFLVPPEQRLDFVARMSTNSLHVPFRFVDSGSEVIFRDHSQSNR